MHPFFPYARPPVFLPADAPAIEASRLAVAHPGARRAVLADADFTVACGCRAALLGANGAGKSTLLKTLAGLLRPAAGAARVFGLPAAPGRHEIAYLAQRAAIEWRFPVTVERLVLSGGYGALGWFRSPGRRDREKARRALERLKLADLADRPIHDLSGGQQQRALLARALCQEARVLLLDEPYAALDTASRDIMDELLFECDPAGLTVLMATHDPVDAGSRFDLVLRVRDGRVETLHPCTRHTHGRRLDLRPV